MMPFDPRHIQAINTIASFLANEQIPSLIQCEPVDVIVLCPSSVLHVSEHVLAALENRPDLAKYLVISGGIGHSTKYLQQSVSRHPLYRSISNMIDNMPEARVIEMIMEKYYAFASMTQNGLKVLIEDKSTNCGANALETRKLLDTAGLREPKSMIVVQDPTMSSRTLASFQQAYTDTHMDPNISIRTCPTFVPRVTLSPDNTEGELSWDVPGIPSNNLWHMPRFLELIMGEIPRLRDDADGYGPRGKGFIASVNIPGDVQDAYTGLQDAFPHAR